MPSSEPSHLLAANGGLTNPTLSSNGVGLTGFDPKDQPVENFRPMKVIAIGAGFSGIYLSIRIPEWLRNVELVVYEKNDGLGGTWWENRYPGCACDIPGMCYSCGHWLQIHGWWFFCSFLALSYSHKDSDLLRFSRITDTTAV